MFFFFWGGGGLMPNELRMLWISRDKKSLWSRTCHCILQSTYDGRVYLRYHLRESGDRPGMSTDANNRLRVSSAQCSSHRNPSQIIALNLCLTERQLRCSTRGVSQLSSQIICVCISRHSLALLTFTPRPPFRHHLVSFALLLRLKSFLFFFKHPLSHWGI